MKHKITCMLTLELDMTNIVTNNYPNKQNIVFMYTQQTHKCTWFSVSYFSAFLLEYLNTENIKRYFWLMAKWEKYQIN